MNHSRDTDNLFAQENQPNNEVHPQSLSPGNKVSPLSQDPTPH